MAILKFDLLFDLVTYIINGLLALTELHFWFKFDDDWSNGVTCILLTTLIWTDKQTDRQTDKPSDEHTCQN